MPPNQSMVRRRAERGLPGGEATFTFLGLPLPVKKVAAAPLFRNSAWASVKT